MPRARRCFERNTKLTESRPPRLGVEQQAQGFPSWGFPDDRPRTRAARPGSSSHGGRSRHEPSASESTAISPASITGPAGCPAMKAEGVRHDGEPVASPPSATRPRPWNRCRAPPLITSSKTNGPARKPRRWPVQAFAQANSSNDTTRARWINGEAFTTRPWPACFHPPPLSSLDARLESRLTFSGAGRARPINSVAGQPPRIFRPLLPWGRSKPRSYQKESPPPGAGAARETLPSSALVTGRVGRLCSGQIRSVIVFMCASPRLH